MDTTSATSATVVATATTTTATHYGFYVHGIPDAILRNDIKLYRLIRKTFPDIPIQKAVPTRNSLYICTTKAKDSYRLKDLKAWRATSELVTVTRVTPVVRKDKSTRASPKVKVAEFPIVVKGISPELTGNDILELLNEESQLVKRVIRLKSGAQGKPTFRVKVIFTSKEPADAALLNGLCVGFKRHSAEQYRAIVSPFCGNCLLWGHGSRECQHDKRCYKCGDTGHLLKHCTTTEIKCANCGASHKTACKGCPAYQAEIQKSFRQPPIDVATSVSEQPQLPSPVVTILPPEVSTDTTTVIEEAMDTTSVSTSDISTQTLPIVTAPVKMEPRQLFLGMSANILAHGWDEADRTVLLSDLLYAAEEQLNINMEVHEIESFAAENLIPTRALKQLWRLKNEREQQQAEDKASLADAAATLTRIHDRFKELDTAEETLGRIQTSTSESEITSILSDTSSFEFQPPQPPGQRKKTKSARRRHRQK